jgi:predicted deacylase
MSQTHFPVDVEAPDISAYRRGNTGVDYVTTFDSGKTGPHAMLSAVVHGNELCGAIILDWLLRAGVRPLRGRLTLAFMNVEAYQRFDPAAPSASRFVDEDFNRLWAQDVLDGPRNSSELRRARALRPVVDEVDVLLDIHSMQQGSEPLMLCGPVLKGRELALALGAPVHVVADVGHAAGKRMRDYGAFIDPASARNALLVECGQHWEQASVDVARDVAVRLLAHLGMVGPQFAAEHTRPAPTPQQVVEVTGPVTIRSDDFRFVSDFRGLEVIAQAGTLIGYDGDHEVRTPYDRCVLIMPSLRRRKGESAVRLGRFVGC